MCTRPATRTFSQTTTGCSTHRAHKFGSNRNTLQGGQVLVGAQNLCHECIPQCKTRVWQGHEWVQLSTSWQYTFATKKTTTPSRTTHTYTHTTIQTRTQAHYPSTHNKYKHTQAHHPYTHAFQTSAATRAWLVTDVAVATSLLECMDAIMCKSVASTLLFPPPRPGVCNKSSDHAEHTQTTQYTHAHTHTHTRTNTRTNIHTHAQIPCRS